LLHFTSQRGESVVRHKITKTRLADIDDVNYFCLYRNKRMTELNPIARKFVLHWGELGTRWGINRTMAQIHALLLSTGQPHSMDEIIDRLGISRGNASMSLRDLMDWGVVQRFRRPGDRKDIYECDADPWQVFARIVRERKRRELDPTREALREILARVPEDATSDGAESFRERVSGLLELFGLIDAVYDQVFRTDESVREAFQLFQVLRDSKKA
jgi:DNA-binding transcriptional regulator GbsR (MarR family)